MSGTATAQRSLRKNFSTTAVGNVVYTASQFAILAVLARLAGTQEVGEYALSLAITAPIFLLLGGRLRQIQATDAREENRPQEFFALRLITSVAASAVAVGIGAVLDVSQQLFWILLAVTAGKALEGQIDVLYGVLHRRELMGHIAHTQMLRGTIGAAVFALVLLGAGSVPAAAFGHTAVTACFVLEAMRRVHGLGVGLRPVFRSGRMTALGRLALPLGISATIGSLAVNAPRYILHGELGASAVGIFAVLAYAMFATGIVVGSLAEVASPRLANYFAAGRAAQFRSLLKRMIGVSLLLGAAGIVVALVAGRTLLLWIFGPEYAQAADVLVVIMVAAAVQFAYLFLGTAVNALRMFTVQTPINAAGLAAVVGVGVAAVPALGLMGAALSILAGQVLRAALFVIVYVRRIEPALHSA